MILAPLLLSSCASAASASEPVGRYVEARTASVFAGACHYGGERTTAGREALMAWTFEAGSFGGVDLSGTCVAAVVSDDVNLDDAPSARRSVVYLPQSVTPEQRDALTGWLTVHAGDVLGEVRAVELAPLSVHIAAERYDARVPGRFELAGDSLPDHACCKMPFAVWYEPFVALERRLVGHDEAFTVDEPELDRAWSRPDENAAFFGRFGSQSTDACVASAGPAR
jgi:hypothetical protein